MSFQPKEEKDAENQIVDNIAKLSGGKIIKLQTINDDGGTDGVIEVNGEKVNIEVRRKGYPNHKGKSCPFSDGWKTKFLVDDNGIFLNELTIRKYKEKKENFLFVVDIIGSKPRSCPITLAMIGELLKQPYRPQKSTNTGRLQSVKLVPLDLFVELKQH